MAAKMISRMDMTAPLFEPMRARASGSCQHTRALSGQQPNVNKIIRNNNALSKHCCGSEREVLCYHRSCFPPWKSISGNYGSRRRRDRRRYSCRIFSWGEKVMLNESQTYAEARLSDLEGRALWLSMYRDVRAERLMAPSLTWTLLKLVILFILLVTALGLSWCAASWLDRAVAWAALALLLAQFAFIGHDAGHGSIARKPAVNRAFGQFAMTFITGLAFDEWIARHRAHHQFCQDETRDPDMAVAAIASLTAESSRRKSALGRFLTRHQAI